MREIIFDTETTGLSPATGDRMVEIGCVEMIDRVETGRTYHAYFNPERAMPSEAESVHGLSDIFLSDKPRFHEKVEELLEFIGSDKLVAHNASFDFGFLNHELGVCRREAVCLTRMIDTVAIARQKFPGAKHSLDALCSRFGIDRTMRVKHGALLDAQLLAQVYIELTGGRQIGLSLGTRKEAGVSTAAVAASAPTPVAMSRTPRFDRPTEQEVERHRRFVAQMDAPIWDRIDTAA